MSGLARYALLVVAGAGLIGGSVVAQAGRKTPRVGEMLPDFTLNALNGDKVQLSKMYKGRGGVVVMLRGWPGYQCPICTAQVAGYMTERAGFARRNMPVVFIYPGPAPNLLAHADEFTGNFDLPRQYTFVIDPDYTVTQRYDLRWDAPKETAYPATFIVDGKGKILFERVSDSHRGRVPANEVLDILNRKQAELSAANGG